ncbi:MAG: hypothetical protein Q9182_005760 [Xanthomendoza sp. 2 TL-2023]
MRFLLAAGLALLSSVINGQTSSSNPVAVPAASSAAPVPSTSNYNYLGCYNETTGNSATGNARALADGSSMNASDTMTVQRCLKFCGEKQYAGLEYGREVRHTNDYSSLFLLRKHGLTWFLKVLVRLELEPSVPKVARDEMQPRLQWKYHSNLWWFLDVSASSWSPRNMSS